jgi:hypothetical protein
VLLKTNSKSKILFGSDPECFSGYERDGVMYALPPYWFRHNGVEVVEEDERHPVFIQTDEFKAHEDGSAWEFAIRPSFSPHELFGRIQQAASAVSTQILSRFPDDCLPNLQFTPVIGWDVERWKDMPKDFFMSTRFGCDPSQDVFNMMKKAVEIDASLHPERYGGGHIHFSGSPMIAEDPDMAVKCQVITSGVAAILYSPHADLERRRTFLYGIPGNFRVQHYGKNSFGPNYADGIEYRTLSATWAGNWSVAEKVLSWAEIGIHILDSGLGNEIVGDIVDPAIEAIMTANQQLAGEVLSYVEGRL